MAFKYKVFIWVGTFAVIFFFRYEIAGHFNLEHMLPAKGKGEMVMPNVGLTQEEETGEQDTSLPPYAKIVEDDAQVFRKKGSNVVAKGNAGHQVTVLDEEDTGQKYINIRYNGIAGFMNRQNLNLNP